MTRLEGDMVLLRIFIGEDDRWKGIPLYEAIVDRMRRAGLAGATVLRGIAGFGAHSHYHTDAVLRLSRDLPIVIEAVDTEEAVRAFLPQMDEMVEEGLITLEKAHVIKYTSKHGKPD